MLKINFVPDDYIQNNESRRTNLIYLALFLTVMTGLVVSFIGIKIRQGALNNKETTVNVRMSQTKDAIRQFETLQAKRKEMMKTALTTAELLEPLPRSILLASLTNNLPKGVSLLQLKLVQKESHKSGQASISKYKAAKNKGSATNSSISDYIGRLSNSTLLGKVALVESKEHKFDKTIYRRFKLTAMLKKDAQFAIEEIKNAGS
jgi:hypothetical protein